MSPVATFKTEDKEIKNSTGANIDLMTEFVNIKCEKQYRTKISRLLKYESILVESYNRPLAFCKLG